MVAADWAQALVDIAVSANETSKDVLSMGCSLFTLINHNLLVLFLLCKLKGRGELRLWDPIQCL
tara:strand:+ start:61 stop:252 length:192 start_codon:yes stop_codon:yes gene_type:complete